MKDQKSYRNELLPLPLPLSDFDPETSAAELALYCAYLPKEIEESEEAQKIRQKTLRLEFII